MLLPRHRVQDIDTESWIRAELMFEVNKSMKVAVRVDQSSEIGSGHLQRCLTLALGLSELGGEITFYRKVSAPYRHLLESRGFEVKELKSKKQKQSDRGLEDNPYQSWLGVSEEEDADDCVGSMSQGNHELVIVDHYALGEMGEAFNTPLSNDRCFR